ncbi:hypothetical protein B0T18DRAFT_324560, partial [Schizothecium vesticola]
RPSVGNDADEFRPERWLEAEGDKLREMKTTADMVFSYRKRACLGHKFALMELEKVLLI